MFNLSKNLKTNLIICSMLVLFTGLYCASEDGTAESTTGNSNQETRKVFVTDTSYNGNLGGFSGADEKCNSDGSKPSGGGTYKAMLVDGTNRRACSTANCSGGTGEHIDWVLKPNTKYVRADGTNEIFTTNANGIFEFGTLSNSISETTLFAWTALNNDWTSSTNNCQAWSSTSGGSRVGAASSSTGNAINVTSQTCTTSTLRLYCVEQ
ncbi:MAG: DUF1554 domain-containing protein [Leptospiraceae bacterium]|nr:DUF1554 domain-containing protein [Leptospiraceae bacterium]